MWRGTSLAGKCSLSYIPAATRWGRDTLASCFPEPARSQPPLRTSSLIEAPEVSFGLHRAGAMPVHAMTLNDNCCPRCGASDTALTLPTSMTRYFVCRRCDYRWQAGTFRTAGSHSGPT